MKESDVNKFFRRVFALIIICCSPVAAFASEIKVGFVDIPYLIDEAPQAQAASVRLEQEFAPRQDSIKARKKDLDLLRSQLDDDDLSQSERLRIEREFSKTERRIKRDEQDFREELNIQKNEEFKQVRNTVLEAIAAFAKTNQYDLIISDGVLFANKRIDVTEQVLEQLQQAGGSN